MSSNSSRWIALLGLLAIAGYQNRDKLREIFGQMTGGVPTGSGTQIPAGSGTTASVPSSVPASAGGGGLLDELRNIFTGGGNSEASAATGGAGGGLAGSVSDILNQFNQAGHGDVADSWVKDGPERQPTTDQLESALGEDAIGALTRQTGLSRDELLNRLRAVLPAAIDQFTPEGRLPTAAEAAGFFGRA